jgi:hypothetical protein
VTLESYCATALALYRSQPDTPGRASRNDRKVAEDLYQRGLSIDLLAHVMRLTHLRRASNPGLGLIRSLSYYRAVLDSLSPEDLHPGYVAYLADTYARRAASTAKDAAFPDRRNHAVSQRR